MIIAAETDEKAMAKWKSYNDGVDLDAIAWLAEQGAKHKVNQDTNVRQLAAPEGAVTSIWGPWSVPMPVSLGCLTRIQPLMKSRGLAG
jgi:alkanesulfonate monooxygenase SsuD/methylene tetrahydromethanopterin reductase-like flavin-dependent oxidoreductase (luciferase family)